MTDNKSYSRGNNQSGGRGGGGAGANRSFGRPSKKNLYLFFLIFYLSFFFNL